MGKDCISHANLQVSSPIDRGIITNWEDMERVWHYCFSNELKVQPEDHPIIITEASLTPKQNRETLTKILFEKFNAPCLYVSS